MSIEIIEAHTGVSMPVSRGLLVEYSKALSSGWITGEASDQHYLG